MATVTAPAQWPYAGAERKAEQGGHHATSVVPGTPDPATEQTHQRDAAAEATTLLLTLSETLPTGPPADRTRAVTLLDRLIGFLLFGTPPPPDQRTLELQSLADSATTLRDTLRSTP